MGILPQPLSSSHLSQQPNNNHKGLKKHHNLTMNT